MGSNRTTRTAGMTDAIRATASRISEPIAAGRSQTCRVEAGNLGDAVRVIRTLRRARASGGGASCPPVFDLDLYNLDVQFEGGVVRVPFKIMTKQEAKEFEKQWKQERKESKKK